MTRRRHHIHPLAARTLVPAIFLVNFQCTVSPAPRVHSEIQNSEHRRPEPPSNIATGTRTGDVPDSGRLETLGKIVGEHDANDKSELNEQTCPPPTLPSPDEAQMWPIQGFVAAHDFLARWTEQPIAIEPSEARARTLVCHILETSDFEAIGQAQHGRTFREHSPDSCAIGKTQSIRLVTPVDELDGTWHILALPRNFFITMYEAPTRDVVHPAASTSLQAEGSFAVREVSWPAWACPTDPEGECVAWHPRKANAKGFYCTDAQAQKCVRRGYDTEVFVMDPITQHALKFGPYRRQQKPRVAVTDRNVQVATDICRQAATLPQ